MKRTIEDSIRYFTDMRKTYTVDTELVSIAIEAMCKYQKIKEVVNNWHHDIEAKDFECMAKIAEVIEDGDDNRTSN